MRASQEGKEESSRGEGGLTLPHDKGGKRKGGVCYRLFLEKGGRSVQGEEREGTTLFVRKEKKEEPAQCLHGFQEEGENKEVQERKEGECKISICKSRKGERREETRRPPDGKGKRITVVKKGKKEGSRPRSLRERKKEEKKTGRCSIPRITTGRGEKKKHSR